MVVSVVVVVVVVVVAGFNPCREAKGGERRRRPTKRMPRMRTPSNYCIFARACPKQKTGQTKEMEKVRWCAETFRALPLFTSRGVNVANEEDRRPQNPRTASTS